MNIEGQFFNMFQDAAAKLQKQINEETFYVKPMTEQEKIDFDIEYAKFKQENPELFDEFGNRKEETESYNPECCCDYCSNYEKCDCGDCEACGY